MNGRSAVYSEAQSEAESRAYNVNWNQAWLDSHTVASAQSETVGKTVTNGVGFATTNGMDFRWDVGGEGNATFGLGESVQLGMKGTFNTSNGSNTSTNNSQDRSEGVNNSATTTDSMSETESFSEVRGGAFSWSTSSAETISQSFGGHVIARTFGVFYRQKYRIRREAVLVAYNLCGEGQVVGEVDFTDWTWSPDLALGGDCPPFPETNLSGAQCLLAPCGSSSE